MLRVPEQLISVYDGDSATLNCFVEAHPPSLNYWEKVANAYLRLKIEA